MSGDRFIRVAHHALIFVLVVAFVAALSAQAVVDPRYVEFNASVDHNTLSDGTPIVSSYSLSIFPQGSSSAFATVSLGKPTPNSSGVIRVDFLPLLSTAPATGVTYEARVSAVGPGGIVGSGLSNTFAYTAPCAPSISPTSRSIAASATTGNVTVTAGTGCAWSATSSAAWISLTGTTSGSGGGTVPYSVAANSTTSQRTGSLTIAGQTFTVTQAGAACTYAITPSSQSPAAAATTGSTSVTTLSGCTWSAASNANWITLTDAGSGSGNDTVSFNIAANTATTSRTGTLTIAGLAYTVTQAGAACTYAITPSSQSPSAAATTGTTSVTAGAGCTWSAASNANWITLTDAGNGSGNDTVSFNIAANTATTLRTGTLTIAGLAYTVTQAAAACTYAISPSSQSPAAAATTGTTSVTAGSGCTWSATSNANWITFTDSGSGSGNDTVSFNIAANSAGTPRTGTLTIAGQTYTVTQGAACTYAITPSSQSPSSAATTGSTSVTTGSSCTWSATSNSNWITLTDGGSGSGNDTVSFSIGANSAGTPRTGTLTIAGLTYTVTQGAAPCTYSISPGSQSAGASATSGSTSVTAPTGCTWTATSNAGWISIQSGGTGTGNGSVSMNIAANTVATPRSGTLTVAGQTYTVNQAAAGCSFSVSPTSRSATAAGGSNTTSVSATAGCAWTAVSSQSWLTVTAGSSGTGPGTVSYSVAANPTNQARSAALTVGGQQFTVNQAAGTCSYSISPTSSTATINGGFRSIAVTTAASCAWTAASSVSWITVDTGDASGTGNGTVSIEIAANRASSSSRTGTLTVAGQTYTVTQAGVTCSYALSPTSRTLAPAAATSNTSVVTSTPCAWTATTTASWITIPTPSGSGTKAISYSVTANTGSGERTGTIMVNGQTHTVTQSTATTPSAPKSLRIVAVTGGN